MDLDCEGYPQIARRLLKEYIKQTGDRGVMMLMDFYKCYRAFVRAKVNCLRLRQAESADEEQRLGHLAQQHLDLAYEYALQFSRTTIYVVCDMIASGKSTVAGALAEALQIKTINSDVVRKKLFSQQSFESRNADFGEGMYRKGATAVTYDKLLKASQEQIRNGHSVILDATFSREYQRRDVLRMAADTDTNIVFIECR